MSFTVLPQKAGIGLRAPHYQAFMELEPSAAAWVEVHSENFFEGGAPLHLLRHVAERCPVSLHGMGLGIGSCERPDPGHLASLKELTKTIQPALVSEHLSFNHASGGQYVNDLLPIPYTAHMLEVVSAHVHEVQDTLRRTLCLENLSSYLAYPVNEMSEAEFLAELVRRTECTLLLDVNNLYVSHINLGIDIDDFLMLLPKAAIKELHLAGYTERDGLLIDSHSQPVQPPVWELYRKVLKHLGPRPTLVEWDLELPSLDTLLAEADQAQGILSGVSHA